MLWQTLPLSTMVSGSNLTYSNLLNLTYSKRKLTFYSTVSFTYPKDAVVNELEDNVNTMLAITNTSPVNETTNIYLVNRRRRRYNQR